MIEGNLNIEEVANKVIGCAIKVHKALGPGLLESAYKECLYYELIKAGLLVEKEKPMPLIYEEVKLEIGYRIDLLVEKKLVIEIKSKEALNDVDLAQTLTYLKIGDFRLGLLINFNVTLLKNGLKRVANRIEN
ncbi:MAG: GxxExxY protein [Bacteroidia bacterium]|nr:GxxExxY protein [Bacteroidia bacterium]